MAGNNENGRKDLQIQKNQSKIHSVACIPDQSTLSDRGPEFFKSPILLIHHRQENI